MSFELTPPFKLAPKDRLRYNTGACMDIPTGDFVRGLYGEHILNAGTAIVTGVIGRGNNFKSTIAEYFLARILATIPEAHASVYDTESNKQLSRLQTIYETTARELIPHDPKVTVNEEIESVVDTLRWTVTTSVEHLGDEYFDIQKKWLNDKVANAKKLERETPFLNRDRISRFKAAIPTTGTVDSFTRFETKDVVKMQDDNVIGDKGGNTIFMRQGISKKRFLTEIQNIANAAYHYLVLTAHTGQKIEMDPYKPTPQALQHMRNEVIKGVPNDFTFLTLNCWHAYGARLLINQTTRAPEYPKDSHENNLAGSSDLNIVSIRQLRGKSGHSGFVIELVVSQTEGVLSALTEFHYIKERKRFGLTEGTRSYSCVLYPEEALSRTTVRDKLDKDYRLRRAVNICAELCQVNEFWKDHHDWWMEPDVLYEKIKELGYDWDKLLMTRGWWTLENEKHELPFLSSRDLCEMAHRRYVPYWMKEEELTDTQKEIREAMYERLAESVNTFRAQAGEKEKMTAKAYRALAEKNLKK